MQRCPILEKANTFQRFPLDQLIAEDVPISNVAAVLTSSGHGGGGFAFGLGTRAQSTAGRWALDIGLEVAFETHRRRTLLINCLPMGVTFQSNAVCIANVSVREDMACAIVNKAGGLFEQIVLCGDPLFLKRLCDYSESVGFDWGRHRLNAIIGEETFPESFRDYLAETLRVRLDSPDGGLIGSSMGVGELGLNLFYETRETIALRRACAANPALLARGIGSSNHGSTLPTFLAYNPLRTFVEFADPDEQGKGDLLVTVLDRRAPIPLMRYKTGDRAQPIDGATIARILGERRIAIKGSSFPLIALHGRTKDYLASGWHVDDFKNLLYRDRAIARQLSGAFHLSNGSEKSLQWDVQLACDSRADAQRIAAALSAAAGSLNGRRSPVVVCHRYGEFPHGLTLDYERKFMYCQR